MPITFPHFPRVTIADDQVCPTDLIDSHKKLHGDEALAYKIGKQNGSVRLPGFATAPIRQVDSGLHLETGKDGAYRLVNERTACLGVYGGPFDEHPAPGQSSVDFEKTNCALKMARFLRVEHDRGLKEILKYSLRSDRSSDRGPWDMDPVMKAWWRCGLQLPAVLAMYDHIYNAWYHVFSGGHPGPQPRRTFRNCLARWMAARFRPEHQGEVPVRAGVEQLLIKYGLKECEEFSEFIDLDKRPGGKVWFDLEGVWDALWAARTPEHIIENIMWVSWDAKYEAGRQFVIADYEFRQKARYVGSKKHDYIVAVIDSDNDYINRAARNADPNLDVLIMTLSSGHHRTFNLGKHLNLDLCAALWREAELFKSHGRHDLEWRYLRSKGTIPECPKVYNSHDNIGVFNSTETSPDTLASGLATRQLVPIYDDGLAEAQRIYHVPPIRVHKQRVAEAKERRRQKKAAAALQA